MLAIIPARGGSKGLPNKNIKELKGIPLIAHSIKVALESKRVTQVIVSTESEEIARIAKGYGASIPFMRPDELATDTSLSIDAYLFTLEKLATEYNQVHDNFVVLQPTSPLRTSEEIDEAISLFESKNADAVISFCEEHHSVFWHKYLEEDGRIIPLFADQKITNRQELKRTYYPNGSIYIFRTELIKQRKVYTDRTFAYIMSRQHSVDIDTIEDFEYAEYLLSK